MENEKPASMVSIALLSTVLLTSQALANPGAERGGPPDHVSNGSAEQAEANQTEENPTDRKENSTRQTEKPTDEPKTPKEPSDIESEEALDETNSEDRIQAGQSRGQGMREQRQEWVQQLREVRAESMDDFHELRQEIIPMLQQQRQELEESGDEEEAYSVQSEIVKLDPKERSGYKDLGRLHDRVHQSSGMKVFVNGEHPIFDVPPVVKEGRTLIPLRAVSNSLKSDHVSWDGEERKVTIEKDDVKIELYIGGQTAFINGEEVAIDVPPALHSQRTMVPLRFISEAFNTFVDYDPESGSAIIVDEDDLIDEENTEGDSEEEASEEDEDEDVQNDDESEENDSEDE